MNDENNWNEYRNLRNEYNRKLKSSKNQALLELIVQSQSDQKKLWRHLKTFINGQEKLPSVILFDDQPMTDRLIIANKLNEYFVNSIDELKATIPFVPYSRDITEREINPWLEFGMVNEAAYQRISV